ncbi:N-acetylmuramoyl-L-alanine amidase [Alkaliphilus peptidifermentans]|uniref:SpoIID/LytB domain protein n=1 Tax=Alkaliphilus peptidifermentans DSM 18978 TaxID=1120976 RepID=A0A1G5KHZ4_9FIRM|nr:N-acetylmuramoyl-L-alanine amidase [Alkaliphilus peptidifermentans]SCZ00222.1 SpoIID/LytB domain protein [Alkaliphilus peptidifermentans DSM 18978]
MENNIDLNIKIYIPSEDKIITRNIEDFVKELLAWSIPMSFHIEALKCQSIIIRTNLIRLIKGGGNREGKDSKWDISIDSFKGIMPIQEYKDIWGKDYSKNVRLIEMVVKETNGVIITFKDKPIDARFHDVCGGATENSENVDGNVVLYLRKVLCNYCQESPLIHNYKDISVEDIEAKLNIRFSKASPIKNMAIEDMFDDIIRDEEGRVVRLKVAGKEFEGKEIMKLLGLESTRFSWKPKFIRFFTMGKGDGVGLCQYGANMLAHEGRRAEEILNYYYTGVTIKKNENQCMKYPLKGKVIVIDAAHGGESSEDNSSINGTREKDINLSIAINLERELRKKGAIVYMTRTEDIFVPLSQRAELINKNKPDFFITIHQNYIKNSSVSGTEIYFFRGDKEAERLGKIIMKKITTAIETIDRGLKTADFYLLRDTNVSGIHVEIGYLSNPIEEKKLLDEHYIDRIVTAMIEAILFYYEVGNNIPLK